MSNTRCPMEMGDLIAWLIYAMLAPTKGRWGKPQTEGTPSSYNVKIVFIIEETSFRTVEGKYECHRVINGWTPAAARSKVRAEVGSIMMPLSWLSNLCLVGPVEIHGQELPPHGPLAHTDDYPLVSWQDNVNGHLAIVVGVTG